MTRRDGVLLQMGALVWQSFGVGPVFPAGLRWPCRVSCVTRSPRERPISHASGAHEDGAGLKWVLPVLGRVVCHNGEGKVGHKLYTGGTALIMR